MRPLLVLRLLAMAAAATATTIAEAAAAPCGSRACSWNILLVGDSTTRGEVPSQASPRPYSIMLQRLLQGRYGASSVEIATVAYNYVGVVQKARDASGKELDITLVPAAKQAIEAAAAKGKPFDVVVVLAGINDLGNSNQTAAVVFPRLVQIYDAARARGADVVVVPPWPNRFVARDSKNEAQRLQLNQQLAQYAAGQQGRTRPGTFLLRLPPSSFDFWNMQTARVKQLQDDLLHLTPAGYDALGGEVFNELSGPVAQARGCAC